jgi:hypothetical protein
MLLWKVEDWILQSQKHVGPRERLVADLLLGLDLLYYVLAYFDSKFSIVLISLVVGSLLACLW